MKLYEIEKLEFQVKLTTKAWVRYVRKSSEVLFIQCYDGTSDKDVQMILDKSKFIEIKRGDYIEVIATKVLSKGLQLFELLIDSIKILSRPLQYPLQKKDASLEVLRGMTQYRTKTVTTSCLMKLRSHIELEIAQYFSSKSIIKITPPLITPSDCEGAGETFFVGKDFFKKDSYLTVSSQMYLESMVRSFSQVYSLAPAFRADPSLSPRHLAEFWMLEAEFITDDVSEVIEESIKLIQFIGQSLLKYPDLLTQLEKDLPSRIIQKISEEFKIISYKDASLFLGKEILGSKEEKDLMEKMSSSVVLTDFPIAQKPFYMKQIGDTTKSFDILVKGVGEVVGGSLREKSSKVLKDRMTISSIQTLQWYLDMREVDEMATGGFGLGFERILMYFLELDSIKDIVPFPRWMGRMDI